MSGPAAEETGPRPGRLPDSDQNEPTLAGIPPDPGASPDDYAPATDPGNPLFKGHVQRGSVSGLMLYQDLAVVAGSNLPELRLDLHVYAAKPQERFALINMRKVHEGDSLQGGVRVETITPDGVEMSHNGTKFLLPKE
jgi:general secretion pathway protein B